MPTQEPQTIDLYPRGLEGHSLINFFEVWHFIVSVTVANYCLNIFKLTYQQAPWKLLKDSPGCLLCGLVSFSKQALSLCDLLLDRSELTLSGSLPKVLEGISATCSVFICLLSPSLSPSNLLDGKI